MNIAIISWQGTLDVLMEYSNIICVLNVQIAEFSGISIFLLMISYLFETNIAIISWQGIKFF